jgi:dTDP-4-dehydrorhamnose reductase
MRVGITGASGMLGAALVIHLSKSHEIFATSRGKGEEGENIEWDCFNLTNTALLNKWLNKVKPDIVIHCAAIVNVDLCEDNVELATKLHVETTKVMVNYLDLNGGKLIYISTDSVFDGKKQRSYNEDDLVSPLNIYAKTKLMGEQSVLSLNNSGLVLRVNIIGWTQEGKTSFAEWMLKNLVDNGPLKLFHDIYFSPLHVDNLSLIIEKIIKNPIFGLYHCASSDSISKYEFGKKMAEIFQLFDLNINRVSVDDMEFKTDRPKNMALDVRKISFALSYDLPNAVDAIKLMKCQYDKNSNLLN